MQQQRPNKPLVFEQCGQGFNPLWIKIEPILNQAWPDSISRNRNQLLLGVSSDLPRPNLLGSIKKLRKVIAHEQPPSGEGP